MRMSDWSSDVCASDLLRHSGFTVRAGQKLSCGLGPLLAPDHTERSQTNPVWLAELVHIAPSRDGAALLPARGLAIEPAQSLALFAAAQSILAKSGFAMENTAIEHLLVTPAAASTLPPTVSPSQFATTSVTASWPQDSAARPRRRFFKT